jgi:hypothetical protein
MDTLEMMTSEELSEVSNFAVLLPGVGKIEWEGKTDVRGLDLDRLILIERLAVQVYYDEDVPKPPVGEGLNKDATIQLFKVFPKEGSSAAKILKFEQKLIDTCGKSEADFIEYNSVTGLWIFAVRHFSRYGLDDDSDDEVDTAAGKVPAASPALKAVTAAKPVAQIADTKMDAETATGGLDGKEEGESSTHLIQHEATEESKNTAMALESLGDKPFDRRSQMTYPPNVSLMRARTLRIEGFTRQSTRRNQSYAGIQAREMMEASPESKQGNEAGYASTHRPSMPSSVPSGVSMTSQEASSAGAIGSQAAAAVRPSSDVLGHIFSLNQTAASSTTIFDYSESPTMAIMNRVRGEYLKSIGKAAEGGPASGSSLTTATGTCKQRKPVDYALT